MLESGKTEENIQWNNLTEFLRLISLYQPGMIVDMKGTVMGDAVVDDSHPLQNRGAENTKKITFVNGANPNVIEFYNSKGNRIGVPTLEEYKAPIVTKTIANKTVMEGESHSVALAEYFSDPNGGKLKFTATKGTVSSSAALLRRSMGCFKENGRRSKKYG